jgi:hypothetical protein
MSSERHLHRLEAGVVSDRGTRFAVSVKVDGRNLPLKTFLHDLIGGAVAGLLSGLHGAGELRHLLIEVRKM